MGRRMMSPTGNRNAAAQSGFTLIEVLVTVVVLFAGVALVLGCFRQAVTVLDAATRTARADLVLREKMTEAELPMAGERMSDRSGGQCDEPLSGCLWERRSETVLSQGSFQLRRIVVTVRDRQSADRHTLVSEYAVRARH